MNPLLQIDQLPDFQAFHVEHIQPAVETLLAENLDAIDALVEDTTAPTWENFVEPLEALDNRLERVWGPVGHLDAVKTAMTGTRRTPVVWKASPITTRKWARTKVCSKNSNKSPNPKRSNPIHWRRKKWWKTPCAIFVCPASICRKTNKRSTNACLRSCLN